MFNLFVLTDWYGEKHLMSSSKIHSRVMEDSRTSNYNWITSAKELINICNRKSFPKEEANDIKAAILDCYSSLILEDEENSRINEIDVAYSLYNSLHNVDDEKIKNARVRFLNSFLSSITGSTYLFITHQGERFRNTEKEWINQNANNLIEKEQINFPSLISKLRDDFLKDINELEEKGYFAEEDKVEEKKLIDYSERLMSEFSEYQNQSKVLRKVLITNK